MRCVNCGFDNEPGRQVCVKCGTSLSSDDYMDSSLRYKSYQGVSDAKPTVVLSDDRLEIGGPQLKQTIVQMSDGTSKGEKPHTPKATIVQGAANYCPRCNYPMMGNYCSNCGYEAMGTETAFEKDDAISQDILEKVKNHLNKCDNCDAEVPAEYSFCPHCGSKIQQKTINIFDKPDAADINEDKVVPCRFSLTPVVSNSQKQPDVLQFEFTEGSFILKRDNIAPGNRTITTKGQAEVRYEDGKWVLLNRSEFDSTFVAAIRPIELLSGDLILMGNQRYRFEPIEEKDDN